MTTIMDKARNTNSSNGSHGSTRIREYLIRQLSSIQTSIIVNSKIDFVFALMKCNYVAFGEQNKMKDVSNGEWNE